jgi:hypothetical protein
MNSYSMISNGIKNGKDFDRDDPLPAEPILAGNACARDTKSFKDGREGKGGSLHLQIDPPTLIRSRPP